MNTAKKSQHTALEAELLAALESLVQILDNNGHILAKAGIGYTAELIEAGQVIAKAKQS